MSANLEELKAQHEKLRLEKRAVDRVTEDIRAKTVEDKRKHAEEIEALEKEIEKKKEKVARANERNKTIETTIKILEQDHSTKKLKQEEEYETKRKSKQKLQFMESKLCTKKVNIEKKVDPIYAMGLQIKELEEEVAHNKQESEEVQKIYDDEMNKCSNIISKLKFQVQNLDKKVAARKEDYAALLAKQEAGIVNRRKELYDKDLLIQRLDFDTKRCEKALPRIEADIAHLESVAK